MPEGGVKNAVVESRIVSKTVSFDVSLKVTVSRFLNYTVGLSGFLQVQTSNVKPFCQRRQCCSARIISSAAREVKAEVDVRMDRRSKRRVKGLELAMDAFAIVLLLHLCMLC